MATVKFAFDLDEEAACLDCLWAGSAENLEPIEDFETRVQPGGICPAGVCPSCGALAHLLASDEDF